MKRLSMSSRLLFNLLIIALERLKFPPIYLLIPFLMHSGRKTLKDEVGILQRYIDLSAPYFAFIREMLEGKSKEDHSGCSPQQ